MAASAHTKTMPVPTYPDEKTDQLGRIDTAALYPVFLERLNALLNACAARGAVYVATSGLRTYAQQDALYAQGRTKPGKIVTKAPGGYSPHNFACAVDFAPHVGGPYTGKLNPDYREENYVVLGEEAVKLGLDWGGNWGPGIQDTPHIQLPLKKHGITWAKLRSVYAKGGYPAVFAFLDKYQW